MKHIVTILIAILIASSGKLSAQVPGTPDLTFGINGKVVYNRDQHDLYNDVQVQTDGKIIAAGTSMSPTFSSVIEVTRYLSDGAFDPSFGTNGHFNYIHNGNPENMAYRCVIKPDGKILIAGHTSDYTISGILLIQLTPNGMPDPGFGTNGIVFEHLSQGENIASGMALQDDGKILVSGTKNDAEFHNVPVVIRYTANGVLDASFGTGGVTEIPVTGTDNDFSSVCVQPDGKILAAGHYESGLSWFTLIIARFDQNGDLDATYGNSGIINLNLGNVDDEFFDMKMSGTDLILVGFSVNQVSIQYNLLLMKFDISGQPVTTFGDNGKVIWGTEPYTFGDALAIQDDGKIVVSGCTGGLQPENNDWALWRFNTDGSPDISFGNNGVTLTDFYGGSDEALGVALWENKILVAGKIRNASDYLDFAVAKYLNNVAALFTSGNTTICSGSEVQFTDQSVGSPTAWNWTFEGGTPATSTLQNPTVMYSVPGNYDVTLVVWKGTETNTLLKPDYIHVEAPVTAAPTVPSGPDAICGSFDYEYNTLAVSEATSYNWSINPASAGTITGTSLTGVVSASNTWQGPFTITVAGANSCGTGPISIEKEVELFHQPTVFSLFAGGGYCNGEAGYEIKLEDSELNINYQLYKDGTAFGTLVPGTGTTLSFGLQLSGTYHVTAINQSCTATMQGVSSVYEIELPEAATQPSGPSTSCNDTPSTFSATLPANGFTLLWTLNPAEAATFTQPTLTTALFSWNPAFSGLASITVQGQNECGSGIASPSAEIQVHQLPSPIVSGLSDVCVNQELTYQTELTNGSTYLWSITGGTLVSGQGTNQISVLWDVTGTGMVEVSITTEAGCTGSSPILQVLVNECTGTNELNTAMVTLFPNPSNNQLNINFKTESDKPLEILIFNQAGQVVYRTQTQSKYETPFSIDISALVAGTYNLQLVCSNKMLNKVFIISRNK